MKLTLRDDAAAAIDESVELAEINSNGGSGGGTYSNTTAAQEKIAADASDKTGYSLSATGLDLVKISDLAGVIAADATLADAISFVTMAIRNEQTATDSLQTISNDAGTPIAEAILSDNGTTTTKGEYTNP
jgi:hypothetical protein